MSAPNRRPPRAWNWTVYATIAAPVMITAILIWQLAQLEPTRWCDVSTDTSKATGGRPIEAVQACFSLLTNMLRIYRQNTLALIVILGISLVTIVITTLKARVDVEGFGWRGKIGGDAAMPVEVVNEPDNAIPVEPKP
jgi:hypothetical protein